MSQHYPHPHFTDKDRESQSSKVNGTRSPRKAGVILCPFPSIILPAASEQWFSQRSPWFPPAGPRYDTRTIVWICLTLITGLVMLLLLLICKKRWVVLGPATPNPSSGVLRPLPVLGAGLTHRCNCSSLLLGRDTFLLPSMPRPAPHFLSRYLACPPSLPSPPLQTTSKVWRTSGSS